MPVSFFSGTTVEKEGQTFSGTTVEKGGSNLDRKRCGRGGTGAPTSKRAYLIYCYVYTYIPECIL